MQMWMMATLYKSSTLLKFSVCLGQLGSFTTNLSKVFMDITLFSLTGIQLQFHKLLPLIQKSPIDCDMYIY